MIISMLRNAIHGVDITMMMTAVHHLHQLPEALQFLQQLRSAGPTAMPLTPPAATLRWRLLVLLLQL